MKAIPYPPSSASKASLPFRARLSADSLPTDQELWRVQGVLIEIYTGKKTRILVDRPLPKAISRNFTV